MKFVAKDSIENNLHWLGTQQMTSLNLKHELKICKTALQQRLNMLNSYFHVKTTQLKYESIPDAGHFFYRYCKRESPHNLHYKYDLLKKSEFAMHIISNIIFQYGYDV